MSLINDALKKAQKQRADGPASPLPVATPAPSPISRPVPSSAPPSAVRYSMPGDDDTEKSQTPRKSSSLMMLWIGLGAVAVIAISVRLTVMFVQPSDKPPVTTNPPQTAPAPASAPRVNLPPAAPAASTRTAQTATPEPIETATAVSIPAARPKPAASPAPNPAEARRETPPEYRPPAPVTPPAPAPSVAPAPASRPAALLPLYAPRQPAPIDPSARIQSFVDRLRVSGIRLSDTGSKVILNDRLFNVGEMVDPGLELRLVKVEQDVLTFADGTGRKYIKLFQ